MMQTADNVSFLATFLKGNLLWKSGSAKSVLKKNGSVLRKCAELVGLSDMKHLRYSQICSFQ